MNVKKIKNISNLYLQRQPSEVLHPPRIAMYKVIGNYWLASLQHIYFAEMFSFGYNLLFQNHWLYFSVLLIHRNSSRLQKQMTHLLKVFSYGVWDKNRECKLYVCSWGTLSKVPAWALCIVIMISLLLRSIFDPSCLRVHHVLDCRSSWSFMFSVVAIVPFVARTLGKTCICVIGLFPALIFLKHSG